MKLVFNVTHGLEMTRYGGIIDGKAFRFVVSMGVTTGTFDGETIKPFPVDWATADEPDLSYQALIEAMNLLEKR